MDAIKLTPQEKLNTFFRSFHLLHYNKRQLILHASDTPLSVFYVQEGYVRVYRLSEQGEELTLTILQPGDFFPLTYGLHTNTNQYFLESMTPLSLWKCPQGLFLKFITQDSEVFYNLITRSFIQFEDFLSRMEYFMYSSAYFKVAAALLVCARTLGIPEADNSIIIPLPLTHRDIATMIGTTRETTSLEMKKLEKQGLIAKSRRYITIPDFHAMEKSLLSDGRENNSFIQL